jgi:hypothetical protein
VGHILVLQVLLGKDMLVDLVLIATAVVLVVVAVLVQLVEMAILTWVVLVVQGFLHLLLDQL